MFTVFPGPAAQEGPIAGKRAAASPPKAKPNPKALSPQARQATSQKARQAYSRAVVQTPQKK